MDAKGDSLIRGEFPYSAILSGFGSGHFYTELSCLL